MDERLTWAMRRMALFAAVRQAVTGRHVYLSTGCLAGRHDYCRSMTGAQGEKRGGRSKFSDAACICRCHRPCDICSTFGAGDTVSDAGRAAS